MKKLSFLVALVPFFLMGQTPEHIINLTHIEVKMGHEAQFAEGVKMYKKCYTEAGGEDQWNFWMRVQGSNSVYAVTTYMENWAAMDQEGDEAGKACRSMFPTFILPHMKSTHNMITEFMPEISKDVSLKFEKGWVTYFRVNSSMDFMNLVKELSGEIKKAEGDERGYWYSVAGGSSKDADFMVVWPFDKYADLDKSQDGVWKVYEKAHGKKKADEMRKQWNMTVADSWSYIYDRSESMSYSE
jgi:hypothetical protein